MRARTINEKYTEQSDPIKDMKIGLPDEQFYQELGERLGDVLSDTGEQNYNLDVDYDEEQHECYVKVEHNADFEDDEGRHPWMEIEITIDFKNKTINGSGNISSKNGDIDEDSSLEDTFVNLDVDEITGYVSDMVDNIEEELLDAGQTPRGGSYRY